MWELYSLVLEYARPPGKSGHLNANGYSEQQQDTEKKKCKCNCGVATDRLRGMGCVTIN